MSSKLQGSMIVLHGPPKVGKTQLVSHFPSKVLWLATEYGHRYIPVDQQKDLIQLDRANGWDTFRQAVSKPLPKGFQTVVVDTASGLYNLCMDWTGKKNGFEHPSDQSHGKGWSAVRLEFQDQVSKLADMAQGANATLIFIDHSKEEEIETTTSKQIKVNCAMPGQARSILLPVPDHIWFLGYADPDDSNVDPSDALKSRGSKRALFIAGSNRIEAGSRDPKQKATVIVPLSKNRPFEQIEKEMYQ